MDAITLSSVKKTYRIGVGRARVREMLPPPIDRAARRVFPRWWARDTFNALEDVSLSIPSGSSVGIVGHNGAGKTTMLKIIAGVTAPVSGSVSVTGRVAALLDVVVGLHPELTGRENIYLFGAMHGLGRRSMRERIDRVIEFAEIDDQIDTPLKRCSAGMVTRIGFGATTAARTRRAARRRGALRRRRRVPAQVRKLAGGIPDQWRDAAVRLPQPGARPEHDRPCRLARSRQSCRGRRHRLRPPRVRPRDGTPGTDRRASR